MSNPSLIHSQGFAPVRKNGYNSLKENRKDISNEPQARRVLGENTKEYKEIYGERNNPGRGRGRSLENSERMPDGGDEQNRRINGDNAPNATDSPKGREFQSEKIEEQAKAPTEGFYAKLIKDENVDIETPKQAVVTNKNVQRAKIDDSQLKAVDRRLHKLENDLSSQGDFINQNIDKIDAETYNNLRQNIEGRYNTEVIKDGYNVYGVPVEKSAVDRFNERYKEYNNRARLKQAQESNKQNLEKFRQRVNEEGNNLFSKVNINPKYLTEIDNFVNNAKNNKQLNENIVIGDVSENTLKLAREKGVDLSGYVHNIDSKAIRHNVNSHSDKIKEAERGQVPLSENDFKNIPLVIYQPDKVDYFKRKGLDHINYEKTMSDGSIYYIEEVRTGKKTLTTKTIYKKVGASAENQKRLTTKETPEVSPDNSIITNNENNFNTDTNVSVEAPIKSETTILTDRGSKTEGFYARLIKENNIPDKKTDDKISPDSRKTQEGYGNRVSLKNGNKKGTIIGSVPTGEDYSGKKRFKYEVRWDDGTVERLSDERVDIETPDSGEDFDLGRFINNIKDKMDIVNSRKQGFISQFTLN